MLYVALRRIRLKEGKCTGSVRKARWANRLRDPGKHVKVSNESN